MEPLIMIVVPGLLGGILVALGLMRLRVRSEVGGNDRLEPPSPGLINMAHIRVGGVGGLGLVAMAATVAIFVPRIRLTMSLALLLGVTLAAALIAFRRHTQPLPSSSKHSGAHSMFVDDTPQESANHRQP